MRSRNKPVVSLVAAADLDAAARAELFEFCDRFSSRHRHRFEAQLAKDETVFLVRGSTTGHLVGFGTLSVIHVVHEGEKAIMIYVGWTMISPEFRKHGIPQRLGFQSFLRQRLKHPLRPIYWMMTSSTLNSYLVVARDFRDSYPKAGRHYPPRESAYIEQVLAHLGSTWDPRTGVIARGGASFYREGRVDQDEVDTSDPDIAFYMQANPGQAEGDSLVCLAPLTLKNFAYIARRQMARKKKRKQEAAAKDSPAETRTPGSPP
jgi:hypothetical protein